MVTSSVILLIDATLKNRISCFCDFENEFQFQFQNYEFGRLLRVTEESLGRRFAVRHGNGAVRSWPRSGDLSDYLFAPDGGAGQSGTGPEINIWFSPGRAHFYRRSF